jgi:hypothetical protein
MTKYQEYYKKMLEVNKKLFDSFASVHADYGMDQDKWQEKFNEIGGEVLKIIHDWENKLCAHSEKAGYGNYTGGLAEKFQQEIKNHFPLIDHVGIIIRKFRLDQIKLR